MKRILYIAFITAVICIFFTRLNASEVPQIIKINITANNNTAVFELNGSAAAQDLYRQLPLSITVKDYGNNEKIFYPPKKLEIGGTPLADAKSGTLAYYAPWGNVVIFYKNFGRASGLYELGYAVSGSEYIREMSGTILIEKAVAHKNQK